MLGLLLLGAVGIAGIGLGGQTRLAAPILYEMTLYVFSARFVLSGPRLTVAVLLALGCLVLVVAGRLGRDISASPPQPLSSPFTIALALYCLVCLVSYGYGMTFALEAAEIARADRAMLLLLAVGGVALLVYDSARNYSDVERLLFAFLIGASALALVACLQAAIGTDLVTTLRLPGFAPNRGVAERSLDRLGIERAMGTATHPIEAGTAMAAALPVALHYATFGPKLLSRIAAAAAAVLLLAGALVTVSRSAFVCLALAFALLVTRWTPGRRLAAFGAGFVALAGLAFTLPTFFNAALAVLTEFGGANIAGADVTARTGDYEIVRSFVSERPLLGRGYGTFDPGVHFATDNQVLKTLLEIGIIGLLALLLFVGATAREAGIARKLARRPIDRDTALTVQTSFLVITASMLFYDGMSFGIALGTMFFLAGCCGALGQIGRSVADVTDEQTQDRVQVAP
jgi:O-antigen ligase